MIHEIIKSPDKLELALRNLGYNNLKKDYDHIKEDRNELIDALSRLIIACEDLANDEDMECFFCEGVDEHDDSCPFFRAVEVLDSLWWYDHEFKAL